MHYRDIWRKANGEIPRDENGISYEIHHKDGNRENNEISNLECLSILEHYQKHLDQGDLAEASAIYARMKKLLRGEVLNDRPLEGTKWYWKGDCQIQLSPLDCRIEEEGWTLGMHPLTVNKIRETSHKASRVHYKDKKARNRKISETLKNKYRTGERKANCISVLSLVTGKTYKSMLEASREENVSVGKIRAHCNDKVKKPLWRKERYV